jgi:hypothetical protein
MPARSEDDIHVKPLDVENPYNTINLQQALAANMQEVLGGSADTGRAIRMISRSAMTQIWRTTDMPERMEQDSAAAADIQGTSDESYTDDSYTDNGDAQQYSEDLQDDADEQDDSDDASDADGYFGQTRVYKPVNMQLEDDSDSSSTVSFAEAHKVIKQMENETAAMKAINEEQAELVPGARTGVLTPLNTLSSGFDDVLQQDSDGQISLVMPDREAIEKQITGQLSIDDVMAEWEHMKQENEKKRMNEVRQRILQNTGNLFDDFDEDTRNDLLEKLEKAFVAAVIKESKEKGSAPDTALLSDEEITRETEKAVRQATEPLPEISDEDLEKAGHKDNAGEAAEEDGSDTDSDEGVEEIAEIEEDGEAAEGETETAADAEDTEEADDADTAEDNEDTQETEETEETEEAGTDADDEAAEDNSDEAADEDTAGDNSADSAADDGREKSDAAPGDQHERKQGVRALNEDESAMFAKYIRHRKQREQITGILDSMSMAAYTGNVIVASDEEAVAVNLTMKLIHALQISDSNFLGKVAKVSGNTMNRSEAADVLNKVEGGALVITHASGMSPKSMKQLLTALESDSRGIIVFLLDTAGRIDRMTAKIPAIADSFCGRVDLNGLDDDSLVEYAQRYAHKREYSIDELGVLALHTRVENMQSNDHAVTVAEMKELVDEAIDYAEKKNPKHFMDTLFGRRYDDDDMIILHEGDFMHNMR